VPILLEDPGSRATLLIRAPDDAALAVRLASLFEHWGWVAGDPFASRVSAVRGDITLPDFGMPAAQLARVFGSASHVIHCAASVKLNMSLEQALATAVTPARTLIGLARRAHRDGSLQKLDLVSTVGVWGRTPGELPERPVPEVREFHNTYEAAKAEAERLVWTEATGLPVTVHRPSMVVGDTLSGRTMSFQVFYHLCEFLSGARTFGVMPHLGTVRLDTVPVDWVARAICWASGRPETAGQVLNLCSGPGDALPLTDLQRRVRQAWAAHGRPVPRLWSMDRRLLQRLLPVIGALTGASTRRALRALPAVLAYLAEEQAFGNTRTRETLAAAGLPLPPVEQYLDKVLGYYLDHARPRSPA
jgi:thioester reductase-like protein